jgi:MFS family permease
MNKYNFFCVLFCSFGAFFYGYDSGLTTSIIGYPEFISYFNFDSTTLGALGSAYYAGNFFGSICNMYLPDKFGRLNVVRFASVISIVGAGMQTGAQSIGVLLAGRAIGGIACGIIVALCPLYASEISPPHVRGRVGGLYK